MAYTDTNPGAVGGGGTATQAGWLQRGQAWIDRGGRPGWIGASVLGFVLFWPVGLGLLGYALVTRRLSGGRGTCAMRRTGWSMPTMPSAPSGNRAFDAYKEETLRRLEEEQAQFEAFLERLREARDKSEFDQFMDERAKRGGDTETGSDAGA